MRKIAALWLPLLLLSAGCMAQVETDDDDVGEAESALMAMCPCYEAAPYSCKAAGYKVGTVSFEACMSETMAGCDEVDPSCPGW